MKNESCDKNLVIGGLKNSTISPTDYFVASQHSFSVRGVFYFRLAVAQTKRYSYTASGGGALQNPPPFSKQAMRGDDRLTCSREGGSISTIDHPSLVDLIG